MDYLKDTCVFIDYIYSYDRIAEISDRVKKNGETLNITCKVLKEFSPSKSLFADINLAINDNIISKINIEDNEKVLNKYNEIRRRYYSWQTDPFELERLINENFITREDVKKSNFRNKDAGECSLLAVSIMNPNKYIIVTEDNGRVFGHPYENLYESAEAQRIEIWKFKEFMNYTK